MTTLTVTMGLEGRTLSQYVGYDFNSYAALDGVTLAAGEDGLYALGGDTDDGEEIAAQVELATTDFGSSHQKRLRSIYVGYESEGDLVLTVTDDEANARSYDLAPVQPGQVQQGGRVVVGRDGVGRYWRLQITNLEGADFSLDRVEAVPVVLSRWVRR